MKETILNVLKKMRTDYGNNENIIFAQDSDLDVVADELVVAINYSQCCTQLLCLVDDFNFLTKGKTYEMESEPDQHYVVIDDFGQKRLLWQKYFERLN